MLRPAPPRRQGVTGCPAKHGGVFTLADHDSRHVPDHTTATDTTRYGHAQAQASNRLLPRLPHRGPWLDHDGELPWPWDTVIRLRVEHLTGERHPKPVWLWSSVTDASTELVDLLWRVFLHRFDLSTPSDYSNRPSGGTRPKLRAPASADRWTWLILIVHTQLRLVAPSARIVAVRGESESPNPAL
jgi:hypothetical protein